MKKIVAIAILGTMFSNYGYCFTTCVRNNSYIGIFKKDVNGTSSESNASSKIWKVVFDYTTLTGYASCNEISGTANTPKTNLVTGTADQGQYCWCEMWPVLAYGYESGPTSYWMYLKSFASDSACASGCASDCENAVKSNATFRTAMFESMW